MAGQKTQADVHAAFFHCRLDLGGGDFFNCNADRRMIGDKSAKELRHEWHIQHRNNAQPQCAAQFSWFTVQFLEKILQLMKECPGVLLKNQTPRGKQNPLPTSLKQRHTKTRFQIPHLLRNTRLRNSEPVSRAAKAPRFRDREKIAEVANVQRL